MLLGPFFMTVENIMENEFPRLVYKDNGPHQRAGGYYDHKCVDDPNGFDDALADGWCATLPDALVAPMNAVQYIETKEPTVKVPWAKD